MSQNSIEENFTQLFDAITALANSEAMDVRLTKGGSRQVDCVCYIPRTDRMLSRFSISYLPGCKHVLIFHQVSVEPTERGVGIGSRLHEFRLKVAKALGAATVICTMLSGNSVEKRILTNAGWTRTATMTTPGIELWSKDLTK